MRWIRSYVLDEGQGAVGTVCIYEATTPRRCAITPSAPACRPTRSSPSLDTVLVRPDPVPATA